MPFWNFDAIEIFERNHLDELCVFNVRKKISVKVAARIAAKRAYHSIIKSFETKNRRISDFKFTLTTILRNKNDRLYFRWQGTNLKNPIIKTKKFINKKGKNHEITQSNYKIKLKLIDYGNKNMNKKNINLLKKKNNNV